MTGTDLTGANDLTGHDLTGPIHLTESTLETLGTRVTQDYDLTGHDLTGHDLTGHGC